MLTFGDSVTIYSHWQKGRAEAWIRTQVQGASWHGGQIVSVRDSGLKSADKYTVRILARDMDRYVKPDDWRALDDVPDGIWTLQAGDVIVKGMVDDEVITGITQITGKYTECFTVVSVFDNRRIALKHLKVEGV